MKQEKAHLPVPSFLRGKFLVGNIHHPAPPTFSWAFLKKKLGAVWPLTPAVKKGTPKKKEGDLVLLKMVKVGRMKRTNKYLPIVFCKFNQGLSFYGVLKKKQIQISWGLNHELCGTHTINLGVRTCQAFWADKFLQFFGPKQNETILKLQ